MTAPARLPKKRINLAAVSGLQRLLRRESLNTVCESAQCPNRGECFERHIATFLIAGSVCTRGCRFCAVEKGSPAPLDPGEPERVARMSSTLALRYCVVTSVTRDDLPDGGAAHFAATIAALRKTSPATAIEVLVPDFRGDHTAAATVLRAKPDVFGHNIETVPALYPAVRRGADYRRSLELLSFASRSGTTVKSGLMLGLGENDDAVIAVMRDLRAAGCGILTLGQYLAPSRSHEPVREVVTEERFGRLKRTALCLGFSHCSSGTYVRSSYRADSMIQ